MASVGGDPSHVSPGAGAPGPQHLPLPNLTRLRTKGIGRKRFNNDLYIGFTKLFTSIYLSSKRKTTDALGTAARRITRIIDMNWDPSDVINAGIALLALDSQPAADAEIASASPKYAIIYSL